MAVGEPGKRTRLRASGKAMIDNFAIGLTHVLMMLAAFRLLYHPLLDREPPARADDRDA